VAGITQQIQQMGTGRPQSAVPCYKMEAVPRGHCVIINNKTFHRDPPSRNPALETRHGTDVDRGYPELETDATSLGKEQKLIPNEADFLLAYSTVPGFVSYRNATQGSWFIGKLTELLNKHAHDHDIMDILTMVKHEVGKTTGRDGVMQAPATLTALRKKVYISPHAGLRVLLLGKTGAAKSSLGNTLLGRTAFRAEGGNQPITLQCQREEEIRGKENVLLETSSLQITDTPGLCDTHRSELDISRELLNGLTLTAPGPHVILMVLRCDRRFIQEEREAYWSLKTLLGPGICNHMICIFNGMDTYEDYDDDGGSTIGEDACSRGRLGLREECREMLKQELQRSSSALQQVLDDAGGRYMGMNNNASRDIRDRQAQDLITKML
ncbi:hypothetical protein BaRGS_00028697, partial [Batillaria attramentaria]